MKKQFGLLFWLLLVASCNLFAAELELPYIVKDSCPFEGCRYGEWEVLEDADIFAEPDLTSELVGKLTKDTKAQVVTGIEIITPGEAKIVEKPYYKAKLFDASKPVYILNDVGEGHSNVFHNGQFIQVAIARTIDRCTKYYSRSRCWVEVIKEPKEAWWVQIKYLGWVLVEENTLQPIDAFGYQ